MPDTVVTENTETSSGASAAPLAGGAPPTTTASAAQSEGDVGAQPTLNSPPEPPKWLTQRLDTTTRRLREAEAELAALKAPAATPAATPAPEMVPASEVQARAARLAAEMAFTEECNKIAAAGQQQFGDFNDTLKNYAQVIGTLPPSFIEGAMETDDAAATLYALGKNLDEIARISSLSPSRQAAAVAAFAAKQAKAKAVTPASAPAPAAARTPLPNPITPKISSSGGKVAEVPLDNPDVPISEWMKRRGDEVRANRQRR